jgi:hypothetical protein
MAAMLVLEPIFEADMPSEQYAYRQNRRAHDAVCRVHWLLTGGHRNVVDADLARVLRHDPAHRADEIGGAPHRGQASFELAQDVARRSGR